MKANSLFSVFAFLAINSSIAAHAGVITYKGFERDSSSSIVIDRNRGIEWLMWNQTTGLSIADARTIFSSNGWELASNNQVLLLFSDFSFGSDRWTNNSTAGSYSLVDWSEGDTSSFDYFISLFGATGELICADVTKSCYSNNDSRIWTSALYGDPYGPSYYRSRATVESDYTELFRDTPDKLTKPNVATLTDSIFTDRSSNLNSGVAFVRPYAANPTPVSAPMSSLILLMGCCWLFLRRK